MSTTTVDEPASPRVVSLHRYPVKGMTPERLDSVSLETGGTMPFDRAYAIENGPGRFDPLSPRHLPKINFLMLMRDERLASLNAVFDDQTETLTIYRDRGQIAKGQLNTPIGRRLIEQFLSSYFATELRGAPKVVSAKGHSFSDVPMKCLHVVNLASLRELERATGRSVDPLRFRANVYVDGVAPWDEFAWTGKKLRAGTVELEVVMRTQRCDATNVNPETAERDMAVPASLQRRWGHSDFGVYAKVVTSGMMSTGDLLETI